MTRPATPYDPAQDGAQMEFDGRMSYGDYLALDKVLSAQNPISNAHDEMLFIIQHQTSELWMKLAIHELLAAKAKIAESDPSPAFKMLTRVARIFEQLNSAWQVLRTMTPSEYEEFRDQLGQSSGFQSYQYRAIEYLAGNKNAAMLRPHAHLPQVHGWLEGLLKDTSLYDEALRLLAREGFAIDASVLERDLSLPHQENQSVRAAWIEIYRDPRRHWPLYELAEKLVDFEDYFRRWRFNHVTTVERVIGFKRGTGGTSGVAYLRRMLDVVLFPELWSIRADL
ncbi:tryptophan 2,3-dioxygenase [Chelativorans intermedius]|uniref:Tryptophan 2,3-dioxygenase n=1 Tax=Chelativorans intermedius TaxID=515947 RepID=A0ABV6D732_9HYPH|nr:tryptophan 2,3-dioxygenase [Chelativorans intermedius]MCT8999537.1 tryptophan 2,3-dioxygenase [Chelativorans intermedius]